jgi:hypothetical protein
MASIVGVQYRNASDNGEGWNIADKIFGYIDEGVNIYNKYRSGIVEVDPAAAAAQAQAAQIGIFGLQKPLGAVILVGGLLVAGLVVYKMVK